MTHMIKFTCNLKIRLHTLTLFEEWCVSVLHKVFDLSGLTVLKHLSYWHNMKREVHFYELFQACFDKHEYGGIGLIPGLRGLKGVKSVEKIILNNSKQYNCILEKHSQFPL